MPELLVVVPCGARVPMPVHSSVIVGSNPAATLCISDGSIAPKHCEIYQRNGRWMLRGRESFYGTYLNGNYVEHGEAVEGAELAHGAVISLGEPAAVLVVFLHQQAKEVAIPGPCGHEYLLEQKEMQIGKLQSDLDEQNVAFASLQVELKAARERVSGLEPTSQAFGEAKQRLEALKKEIAEIRTERDQLRERLLEAAQHTANRIKELEAAHAREIKKLMDIINASS